MEGGFGGWGVDLIFKVGGWIALLVGFGGA